MMLRPSFVAIALAVVGIPLFAACGSDSSTGSDPSSSASNCPTPSGTDCAAFAQRTDGYEPTFSNPTKIDNRYFPVSSIHSNVFIGLKDGKQFRSEGTLLPRTRKITWKGKQIETLVFQYMAFFDGRIEEVAYDWFGQDDKGAVWYFGEDVADYDANGTVYTHEGTWLVERDGKLAMIMPGAPALGNVWRAEDAFPAAFEEITIKTVGETREGPSGTVRDIMVGSELKMDGEREEKVFAPGYGEFSTGSVAKGGFEPLALSVPTDALQTAAPAELAVLSTSSAAIFASAAKADWATTNRQLALINDAVDKVNGGAAAVPPLLKNELTARKDSLSGAIKAGSPFQARQEAIALARVTLDLRLRHDTPIEIDRRRFALWLAQVQLDATTNNSGGIRGDVSTLELIWDRVAHGYDANAAGEPQRLLTELRRAADASNTALAASLAEQLHANLHATSWN